MKEEKTFESQIPARLGKMLGLWKEMDETQRSRLLITHLIQHHML